MTKIAKNTICLWHERDAEEAARFYARNFPDSSVGAVHRAPGDYPAGKQGDVLTVEFTVMGIPCLGLNGGPGIQHNEAFSFQVATEDQAETYTSPDRAAAKRAFDAMMTMRKIDIAVIEAAVRGEKPSA
ncbi:VOC family protein [Halomonas sp. RA08-2]|uniref:VOC family protein n=1 Tax=Halomonas sp. RA08-2 TaxID=3440842 RepID=UPI003EEC275B